jgi:hypothetical protein
VEWCQVSARPKLFPCRRYVSGPSFVSLDGVKEFTQLLSQHRTNVSQKILFALFALVISSWTARKFSSGCCGPDTGKSTNSYHHQWLRCSPGQTVGDALGAPPITTAISAQALVLESNPTQPNRTTRSALALDLNLRTGTNFAGNNLGGSRNAEFTERAG